MKATFRCKSADYQANADDSARRESNEMDGGSTQSRVTLGISAIAADAGWGMRIDLADLWHTLMAGARQVIVPFASHVRCGLVVTQHAAERRPQASRSSCMMLAEMLCGVPQNALAIDHGVSASTVATRCRKVLAAIGHGGVPSRASPVLALAAYAATRNENKLFARSNRLMAEGVFYEVVGIDRPERAWADRLPVSEFEVVQLLVEGATYAAIATRRGTSVRTVANQIASAFRRTGVSGRLELIAALAAQKHAESRSPGPPLSAPDVAYAAMNEYDHHEAADSAQPGSRWAPSSRAG